VAAASTDAGAALTLRLSDGVQTVTIVDTDGDGLVSYDGTVGSGWRVRLSTGRGGGSLADAMELDSARLGPDRGTLWVALSEDGLRGGSPSLLRAGVGGIADASLGFELWTSASNDLFGMGSKIFDGSASGSGAFAFTGGPVGDFAAPYSMTLLTSISHGAGTQLTSVGVESSVPEPGTLGLLAVGLLGVGATARRRPV
jgi:hypothetical protein